MGDRLSAARRTLAVSLTLAMLALAGPSVARAAEEGKIAEEVDITGEYVCRGDNPGGGTYTGKVVITKTGQTYRIQWKIGAAQAHAGTGIREGNVLAVCFVGDGSAGVVAYKIDQGKDGLRLVGRWAGFADQKTQSETLTKGGPVPRNNPQAPRRITRYTPHPAAKTI